MIGVIFALSLVSIPVCRKEARAEIGLQAVNNRRVEANLEVVNGIAQCTTKAIMEAGITKVAGTMKLVKVGNNGNTMVASWNVSSDSRVLNVSKTASVTKGMYRLILTVKVYRGKSYETVTATDTKIC